MFPASFAYVAPKTLPAALQLLKDLGDDAKLLAGGHSLIPALKLRLAEPGCLIDIGGLDELRGVRIDGDALVIGSLTVHTDVAASDLVRQHAPGLADAAGLIGDVQVRNRGTIGGSVAHADPAADLPVMLAALNASFVLVSVGGSRTVTADDFFTGFFSTALAIDEVVSEIRVPLDGGGSGYAKLPHPASGYVVVSAGARLVLGADGVCASARVVLGGLGGGPLRATATENVLQGQRLTGELIAAAAALAAVGADPDDDPYASAAYKRAQATVYARRALLVAFERAGR